MRNLEVANVTIANGQRELGDFGCMKLVFRGTARDSKVSIANSFDLLAIELCDSLVEEFEEFSDHLHHLSWRSSFS